MVIRPFISFVNVLGKGKHLAGATARARGGENKDGDTMKSVDGDPDVFKRVCIWADEGLTHRFKVAR